MKKVLSVLFIFLAVFATAQEKNYAPTLVAPAANAIDQKVNALLDWNPVSGGIQYQVNIDSSAVFSNPQTAVVQFSAWQASYLLFSTPYYWRVRSIDVNSDTSAWSAVRSFTTASSPVLLTPANNFKYGAVQQTLKWKTMSGVDSYQCQFDTSASFSSPFLHLAATTDTTYTAAPLFYGDTIFWRIRAIHINDTSSWCSYRLFGTRGLVNLLVPSDSLVDFHPVDSVVFESVYGTSKYEFEFDTDPLFSAPSIVKLDSSVIFIGKYPSNTMDTTARGAADTIKFGLDYHWRVRLINSIDTSVWSNSFLVSTIDKVALASPVDAAVDVPVTSSFFWNEIRGSLYYILEYDTSATFANVTKVNVSDTSFTPATNLFSQKDYYWKVRSVTSSDTSDVSEVNTFTTYYGVGVEENTVGTWSVYPNPTNGVFQLNIESATSARVEILNLLGDVVYSQNNLSNGSNTIYIENLNDGIYMMRLYIDSKLFTSRIVKK